MIIWFDPQLPTLALSQSPACAPSLSEALDAIERADITHIVCLQEAFELSRFDQSFDAYRRAVRARGITLTHEPIEDFCAPSLEQAQRLVDTLSEALAQHQKILVHCQAGLGRAGTIAALLLVDSGMSAADAIVTTRYYRPGAIQSEAQEAFIAAFTQDRARRFSR